MAALQPQSTLQLSRNQQNLLLAALNAQAHTTNPNPVKPEPSEHSEQPALQSAAMTSTDQGHLFISPQSAELDSFNDFTPDLDYLDGDGNFDFENADLGGEMIGALPGSGEDIKAEQHDKRKSPDENDDDEEGSAKRQETGEEKGSKKPGRKPLTSEPTTKRKAQNRAAQRAFRERKEKHLKDLETKVAELTKTQEADKHEKGLLKAQVERLQSELKDYRKRLSLGSTTGRSPPLNGTQHRSNSGSNYGGNQFQFDFPKFGDLPGSQMMNNTPPASTHSPSTQSLGSRHDSNARSLSPGSAGGNGSNIASPETFTNAFPSVGMSTNNNMHGFASTLPQMNNDPFGDLFSPSILKNAGNANGYFSDSKSTQPSNSFGAADGGDSSAGLTRVFQFNSGSTASDSASPSNSSSSQWNANTANSSCGTSPEPFHGSPANKDTKQAESFSQQNNATNSTTPSVSKEFSFGNNYSLPSSNNYDPVLFGDYRENQDPLLNNTADFTGGFFDDALNAGAYDFGSPTNLFGILSPEQSNATLPNKGSGTTPSRNLMAEVEKARDGGDDDYGLTTATIDPTKTKMINCNNIWNQLQSNPDFQDGKFDLDSLCSELKAKARCSESGVVVSERHVNAALQKLSKKTEDGGPPANMPPLMFEQDSWDQVMKKMGGNAQV